ncbi:hypothetical protein OF83DRAFT_726254 [Amylostereum chailletii]|nr:hypothetical protein OF83DRAFT_726254 [Amylostereum chailletii]
MRPLHPISGAQLPMTERTQQRLPSLPSRVSSSSIVHPGSPPTTSASKSEHEAFPNPHTNAHPPPSSKHRGHPSILHAVKSITIRNPFRSAGSQRSPIITDLFRDAVATPDLNVGSVSTFVPRITKPIAPVRGFPQRADVVEHCRISADCTVQGRRNPHRGSKTLDCADIRRTQDGDVDGLFFASRCRGSGPKVHAKTNKGPSKEGGCSRPSTGQSQRKKPPADFLNVTIPNPSIALFDDIL